MSPRARKEVPATVPGPPHPALERAMLLSGFCAFASPGSHGYCHEKLVSAGHPCLCPCHDGAEPPTMEGFTDTIDVEVFGSPARGQTRLAPPITEDTVVIEDLALLQEEIFLNYTEDDKRMILRYGEALRQDRERTDG